MRVSRPCLVLSIVNTIPGSTIRSAWLNCPTGGNTSRKVYSISAFRKTVPGLYQLKPQTPTPFDPQNSDEDYDYDTKSKSLLSQSIAQVLKLIMFPIPVPGFNDNNAPVISGFIVPLFLLGFLTSCITGLVATVLFILFSLLGRTLLLENDEDYDNIRENERMIGGDSQASTGQPDRNDFDDSIIPEALSLDCQSLLFATIASIILVDDTYSNMNLPGVDLLAGVVLTLILLMVVWVVNRVHLSTGQMPNDQDQQSQIQERLLDIWDKEFRRQLRRTYKSQSTRRE